jgi:hypothetical protein
MVRAQQRLGLGGNELGSSPRIFSPRTMPLAPITIKAMCLFHTRMHRESPESTRAEGGGRRGDDMRAAEGMHAGRCTGGGHYWQGDPEREAEGGRVPLHPLHREGAGYTVRDLPREPVYTMNR